MITLEDCVGFCGLTEEEVLAIAEHEHLPEIAATALAQYLLSQEHGSKRVRDMIVDDIRRAQVNGVSKGKVLMQLHVLHHFLKTHPEATPPDHPLEQAILTASIIRISCTLRHINTSEIGRRGECEADPPRPTLSRSCG